MLIIYTDFNSGNSIAVNPAHVVCVFTAPDEKTNLQTTVINMLNGNVAVTEEYSTVVGQIQSELR